MIQWLPGWKRGRHQTSAKDEFGPSFRSLLSEGLRTPDPEYSTGLGKKKKKKKELPQTKYKDRRRKYFYMFPRRQRQLTSA